MNTGGLFRRYVVTIAGLVAASLVLVGCVLVPYLYREARARAEQLQAAEALIAADAIESYLHGIEHTLSALAGRSLEGEVASREAQALDFRQALKFEPAILNIRALDGESRETNFVSRIEPDRIESMRFEASFKQASDGCKREFCYGLARTRDQIEPYTTLQTQAPGAREAIGAELSLRFINDLLGKLAIEQSARAYVVDQQGHLVAHPDLQVLLSNQDVSQLAQVRLARAALAQGDHDLPSGWGQSPEGGSVFTSVKMVQSPGWLVYVEQPSGAVLASVRATIGTTIAVLALGATAAIVASFVLAGRLTRPILQLRDGALRVGRGELSASIPIHTRDEVAAVAAAFNAMAHSLQDMYDSLETKVVARTRELASANHQILSQSQQLAALNAVLQEQLRELQLKREAADRASAAKTRFVAAASHDLRQPIHAVGLLVGILAERPIPPELRTILAKVQESVSSLEVLLGTLLDMSKLDAGIVRPSPSSVSIGTLLSSLELTHGQTGAAKGLRVRVALRRTRVLTDGALLFSILSNLLSNAIRYTRTGHVDVYCRKSGRQLEIFVSDSGIGIPADQLERIFEEYYQLPGSGQGLGLGLAIVKRTADLLGSALSVKSVPGKGSTFSIKVPYARQELTVVGEPLIGNPTIAGSFVVIVDDNEDNRYATDTLFRNWGCHVLSASSGDALLAELSGHLRQPDLIIADYRLGSRETGFSVVSRIRSIAEAEVPALILTADHPRNLDDLTRPADIEFIQKPANATKIYRIAQQLLAQATTLDRAMNAVRKP